MTSLNYDMTRMSVEERVRVAEHRRMVRQAKLEARALRPKRPGPLAAVATASRKIGQLAPWRVLSVRAARKHALHGA